MGLDTYAAKKSNNSEERVPLSDSLFQHIPPVLVGGLLSGHGSSNSFRGKVYDDFITHISDMTLYSEEIPNLQVHIIVAALQDFLDKKPSQQTLDKLDISLEEVKALRDWFKIVADCGGVVVGWW